VDGSKAVLERNTSIEESHTGSVDGTGQLVATGSGRLYFLQGQLDGSARMQLGEDGAVTDRLDRVLVDLFLTEVKQTILSRGQWAANGLGELPYWLAGRCAACT
jgi:hypothetical protein